MANRLKDAFKNAGNKLSDAISNVVDEASAGADGLTGPEHMAAQAHGDFADLDDLDSGNTQVVGDPDTTPPAQAADKPAIPLSASLAIDGLAKQYVLKGYEALQRTPNPDLSDSFRGQLLHFRELVNTVHKMGVRGPGKLTAAIVGVLAVDQRGKIDAITFLRQIMRQAVWNAAVDVQRWRRAEAKGTARRFGEEDDTREAPMGMDGMSDHSDAIAGVAGSSEAVLYNEADCIAALVEVNGYLSAFADTICDDENDRLYLGLESGLAYTDKPGLMAGSWIGVYDPGEAIDIQMIKNQESLVKRDAQQAERRRKQLALLAAALG